MKWYSKLAVLLLGTGLYFPPPVLLAQEKISPSPKASDIQDTSPASLSESESKNSYSRQDLCQISKRLSESSQSNEQIRSGSDSVLLESPSDRKIRQGFPLSKVLGSLGENDNQAQSKASKTPPKSNDCN